MTGTATGPRVRPARKSDAGALARVYVESWRAAYAGLVPDKVLVGMSHERQERSWADAITGRTGPGRWATVLAAVTADGEVVGVATCGAARKPNFEHEGEIFTLYVAPDLQGEGFGRALLAGCFSALAQAGCGSALVWVLAENPARFFYTAMGGRKIAARREKLWGAELDEEAYGWADLAAVLVDGGPGR